MISQNRPLLWKKSLLSSPMLKQVNVKITGRVQGVFFRSRTQEEAGKLGIKGWVRNTPDGKVEIVAQADDKKLEEFLEWCRKGPSHAKVDQVKIKWQEISEEFPDFRVL